MVKFKKTFSVAKSCTKQAKGKINVFSSYVETKGLHWENFIGICTDGAPSAVASITGFASLKKILTLSQHTTLFTERCWFEKTLTDEMKNVSDDATKIVSFIKQRPVHSRIIKKLW
jgi:hypothetical protein